VKRLLERLRKPSGNRQQRPRASDESSFFSTMFIERGDDASVLATWAARAAEVRAEPFDRRHGAELFLRLWGDDRHVAALGPADLARMCEFLQFVSVPAGREVIGQDEQGDYLLIVLDGTLAVDRVQPWGGRARLAEARAGEMLGEMSLLDAGARFSACTTLSPCTLAVVDATRLDQMVHHEPRLALALLTALSRRLSLRLRQVSARLSALLSRS
jgi:CRP-like cAMP-binding protein